MAITRRAGALALGLGAMVAVAASPARATAWRPEDSNLTLAFAPPFAIVLNFDGQTLFGYPVPPGIDPGAALTDPVATASFDTLRGRDENALYGAPTRDLSPDESADDAGSGEHDPGSDWYGLVATLSSSCTGCSANQTTQKIDLMRDLGLLPKEPDQD